MADEVENEEVGPVTMAEWRAYLDGLSDEDLYEVAIAAGTLAFGQKLLGEGYSADDVSAIRVRIAERMAEETIAPPTRVSGCVVDYRALVPAGTFAF